MWLITEKWNSVNVPLMTDSVEIEELFFEIESCLDAVNKSLTEKTDSRMVTRWPEKNLLTYKCMNKYDKWRRFIGARLGQTCTNLSDARCQQLRSEFSQREEATRKKMLDTFVRATKDEDESYANLLKRVELGTNLVKIECPFTAKIKLPES